MSTERERDEAEQDYLHGFRESPHPDDTDEEDDE